MQRAAAAKRFPAAARCISFWAGGIDKGYEKGYNISRWLCLYGEMAERLMALVLKTSDTAMYRGFESLSLRHFFKTAYSLDMEKYPRGRRGSPAKGVVCESAARVQIPASPPSKDTDRDIMSVSFLFYILGNA